MSTLYSGCAVCSPSRATLLTGRHHIRTGVYSWIHDPSQKPHLLERELTIAEVLKAQGYATAHVGKWHLGLPTDERQKPTPDEHGFDTWFATWNNATPSHRNPDNFIRNGEPVGEIEGYSCQIVVDEAIGWLEQHRPDGAPFFLNVWFHEPHAPIAAPDDIVANYGDLDGSDLAPILKGAAGEFTRHQPLFWHLQKARPIVAMREGDFSLVAYPDFPLSTDNMFQEAWIPTIRTGSYAGWQLFNLRNDPAQTHDLAGEEPERLERMKDELLEINASIMADGVEW